MITKTITYEDFDGNEVTEKLYFNLSLPEVIGLKFDGIPEGINVGEYLQNIAKKETNSTVFLSIIEQFLLKSYGVKSEDGKRFIKSPTITEDFRESAAFDAIFTDFLLDPNQLPGFIEGILPKGSIERLKAVNNKPEAKVLTPPAN